MWLLTSHIPCTFVYKQTKFFHYYSKVDSMEEKLGRWEMVWQFLTLPFRIWQHIFFIEWDPNNRGNNNNSSTKWSWPLTLRQAPEHHTKHYQPKPRKPSELIGGVQTPLLQQRTASTGCDNLYQATALVPMGCAKLHHYRFVYFRYLLFHLLLPFLITWPLSNKHLT